MISIFPDQIKNSYDLKNQKCKKIFISELLPNFKRIVTQQERRFLMSPCAHISLGLKLIGNISIEKLRNSVNKMLRTYPLLGVRIKLDNNVLFSTTENASAVPIIIYKRKSDWTWLEVINKENSIPVKPSIGPLTRIILVHDFHISELFILCHHTICDGRSLELAIREILLNLKNPNRIPPSIKEKPPQTPEIFPLGISKSRFTSWYIERLNKKWQKKKVLFDEEDLMNIYESFWKNSSYCIELITLNKDETQRLIEICRTNDVTVNSALLIVFVKARGDTYNSYKGKVKIGTAVDTRNRLRIEIGDAVGLYAGGVIYKFKYIKDRSFWDNVREYHKVVKKTLTDNNVFNPIYNQFFLDPTLSDAMLFAFIGNQVQSHQSRYNKIFEFANSYDSLVAKYLKKISKNISDVMSTNIGKLNITDEIDGIKIERAFFTPSSGLKLEIVLGVATAGGRLTISLNYHNGYINGNNIKKIRDRAEKILKNILT
jgi:NRPS condensation-like uncharacterized protein